ncbi:hypothetical protein C8F04DRAFT_1188126 [Mycena alexandri]|uniref:Uncharacterized protein n=1 Tax=Mycena alexandri TaxID=1745969 RepID=A0AAD6SK20_9AGAR|nr:hypothetical protein C8F04DRAFT_1188126 [Mycena alexandri]
MDGEEQPHLTLFRYCRITPGSQYFHLYLLDLCFAVDFYSKIYDTASGALYAVHTQPVFLAALRQYAHGEVEVNERAGPTSISQYLVWYMLRNSVPDLASEVYAQCSGQAPPVGMNSTAALGQGINEVLHVTGTKLTTGRRRHWARGGRRAWHVKANPGAEGGDDTSNGKLFPDSSAIVQSIQAGQGWGADLDQQAFQCLPVARATWNLEEGREKTTLGCGDGPGYRQVPELICAEGQREQICVWQLLETRGRGFIQSCVTVGVDRATFRGRRIWGAMCGKAARGGEVAEGRWWWLEVKKHFGF